MAGIYANIRQQMITGAFTWTSGSYNVVLVSSAYVPDYDNHHLLSDIPAGDQLGSAPITGLAASGGYAKAAALSVAATGTIAKLGGLAIVRTSDNALVCFLDQGTGFQDHVENEIVYVLWNTLGMFKP